MNDNVLILSSDCIKTKGFLRSVICDTLRQTFYLCPNFEFIDELSIEFRSFLIKNEVILEVSSSIKKLFPPLELQYETYSKISNLVFHIDSFSEKTIEVLKSLNCLYVAIDVDQYNHNVVSRVLKSLDGCMINSIELHIIELENDETQIHQLNSLYNKFSSILPFLYIESRNFHKYMKLSNSNVFLRDKSCINIEGVRPESFFCNIHLLSESQNYNTYYNRKLYIDEKGFMKNAPGCQNSFGNINSLTSVEIIEIVDSADFQKYWRIHKGLIDVCKHCEYRHMCVDNRVPVKRNEKQWYMTTECNYNPYIAKWKGEEGYRTLAECGVQSNEHGFRINRKKINQINKELWGDD